MQHMRADIKDKHTACWLPHLAARSNDTMLIWTFLDGCGQGTILYSHLCQYLQLKWYLTGRLILGWRWSYGLIQSLALDRAQFYIFYLNNLCVHAHRLKSISSVAALCSADNLITAEFTQVPETVLSRKKRKQLQLKQSLLHYLFICNYIISNKMSSKPIHMIKTGKTPLWRTSCGM